MTTLSYGGGGSSAGRAAAGGAGSGAAKNGRLGQRLLAAVDAADAASTPIRQVQVGEAEGVVIGGGGHLG